MERGIRQGDPLSPFLFILAAEGLRIAMEEAVHQQLYTGIKLPGDGPNISILQYADDALFLGEWTEANITNLLRILSCFHLASGLKINLEKSKLFGINVMNREINHLANRIGCEGGRVPFIHLGMPIGAKASRITTWMPLIEKFNKKMSAWKARSLSIGGRLTLCKSVLGSLGSYLFSLFKVPTAVLKKLESIRCGFLWGTSGTTRKIAWVSWIKTLNSMEKGGLQIGSLRAANVALLGKWWWRFKKADTGLWMEVIKSLYGCDGGLGTHIPAYKRQNTWGVIANLNNLLVKANIGMEDFLEWDGEEATWKWNLDPNETYSVRSLRNMFDNNTLETNGVTIWCRFVPRKTNIFMWRLLLNRIATKDNLISRGINIGDVNCPACNCKAENVHHLFIDCSTAKEVRSKLFLRWHRLQHLSTVNTIGDIIHRESNRVNWTKPEIIKFDIITRALLWILWKNRNDICFNRTVKSTNLLAIEVLNTAYLWFKVRCKLGHTANLGNWL